QLRTSAPVVPSSWMPNLAFDSLLPVIVWPAQSSTTPVPTTRSAVWVQTPRSCASVVDSVTVSPQSQATAAAPAPRQSCAAAGRTSVQVSRARTTAEHAAALASEAENDMVWVLRSDPGVGAGGGRSFELSVTVAADTTQLAKNGAAVQARRMRDSAR